MKKLLIFFILVSCTVVHAEEKAGSIFKNDADKASYSIGTDVGNRIKSQTILDLNLDLLLLGVKDAMTGEKIRLADDEKQTALTNFQKAQQEHFQALGEKAKVDGEKFMKENEKKEDITTLESGLQYRILRAGKGVKPKQSDKVEIHYKGSLLDGTVFDDSYKRGKTGEFNVVSMILGMQQALTLMPINSKWQIYVPPSLGYGPKGAPPLIPASSTLVFEVELFSIKEKSAEEKAADEKVAEELKKGSSSGDHGGHGKKKEEEEEEHKH